jgi:hypothetical protein
MSALTRFFFSPVYAPKSMWSVVNWWESRRALYNLTVGAAGIMTVVTVTLLSWIHPHPLPFRVPLGPILLYAFMANLFYSMGPVVDVFITAPGDRNTRQSVLRCFAMDSSFPSDSPCFPSRSP